MKALGLAALRTKKSRTGEVTEIAQGQRANQLFQKNTRTKTLSGGGTPPTMTEMPHKNGTTRLRKGDSLSRPRRLFPLCLRVLSPCSPSRHHPTGELALCCASWRILYSLEEKVWGAPLLLLPCNGGLASVGPRAWRCPDDPGSLPCLAMTEGLLAKYARLERWVQHVVGLSGKRSAAAVV